MESSQAAAVQAFRAQISQRVSQSISSQQKKSLVEFPLKEPHWLSRVTFPVPDNGDLQTILFESVKRIGYGDEEYPERLPKMVPVKGEWIGPRKLVRNEIPRSVVTEEENFNALERSVSNTITLFYVHGGAFFFGTVATIRPALLALAKMTGGRGFGAEYRLAPQNPFPVAIFDVFVSYLSLLYPPPGAFHKPVAPEHIVFTGESSGANLALAVLQIIRDIRDHRGGEIPFHGQVVKVPFPAGFAAVSISDDKTNSLPTYVTNAKYDVLGVDPEPALRSTFPSCEVWPSKPPRGDLYCEVSTLSHPLVSSVTNQNWVGFPPMWLAAGEEQLADDTRIIAQEAARQGVLVQWSEYGPLPHIFPLKFPRFPQSMHLFQSWVKFCRQSVLEPKALREYAVKFETVELKPSKRDV